MYTKEKELVIERWKKTGFMVGVKEGSALERKLAYSYDNMALTILSFIGDEELPERIVNQLNACQLFSFPIIRACLTTKGRITHSILPEQVLWPLMRLTCEELFKEVSEKNPKFKKRIYAHDKMRAFLQLNNEYQSIVIDVLMKYMPEDGIFHDENNTVTLDVFKLFTDVDFVAYLLNMVSDYIKLKSNEFDEGLLAWEKEVPYSNEESKERGKIVKRWENLRKHEPYNQPMIIKTWFDT